MRQAIWFAQTRPREGVLRFVDSGKSEDAVGGVSPQPVKNRCWWSRERTLGASVGPAFVVVEGEDDGLEEVTEGFGPPPLPTVEVVVVVGARVELVRGSKRSLTWFATIIAQSCSRASFLSNAPTFTSCADRVASAAGLLEGFCSAR